MASMTFQVNDASTGGTNPAVWVTIAEGANGTLNFTVTQEGGIIGDLRGLFFDLADESLLKSLVFNAVSTDIRVGDDSIKDLGDGANMNGLLGSDKGYDVGIEIGTSGIGKDDIRSYSFTLDSSLRDLTLDDFANVDFGVRLTSVGMLGGTRADSSKILEQTSQAISSFGDAAMALENGTASGNVLSNDSTGGGTTTVTGFSGGALGSDINLTQDGFTAGTLQVHANGSYNVDVSQADALSEGEVLTFDFTYDVKNQTEATSWSVDTATFTVTVHGVNDGPVAVDDDGGHVLENAQLSGSVIGNDSDVDRLDTHTWSLINGSFDGQGSLTMAEDGTWHFDAQGAYDYLNDGESVQLSFQYLMADNHGGTDVATVSFVVDGVGQVLPPPPPPPEPPTPPTPPNPVVDNDFPLWAQDISNFTLIFDQTLGDVKPRTSGDGYYTVKVNVPGDFNDDMDVSIDAILAALNAQDPNISADSDLLGVVIKGGLQITQYYAYGEHNTNGTAADVLPEDLGFVLPGDHGNVDPTNAIDVAYEYTTLMAG